MITISSGAATTKRLTRLETAQLITRTPVARDRRETLVQLTPQGQELIDALFPQQLDRESTALTPLTPLTPNERTQLAALLARVLTPIDRL